MSLKKMAKALDEDNAEQDDALCRVRDAQGGGNLSDWEESFLLSVEEQLEAGRKLTDAQEEKLNQIESKQ